MGEHFLSILSFMDSNQSNGIYLIEGTDNKKFLSYSSLRRRALLILNNLNNNGLKKGDKVIIKFNDKRIYDNICVFWACLYGGIIPIPINDTGDNKLKIVNILSYVDNCKVICSLEDCAKMCEYTDLKNKQKIKNSFFDIEDLLNKTKLGKKEDIGENDIAFIQFSSGTTGLPKGAMITHKNLIENIKSICKSAKITKSDYTGSWMPLCHDMGLIGFHLVPAFLGINQSIMPTSLFIKNPILFLRNASEENITLINATNFALRHILRASYRIKRSGTMIDLRHIRKIFIGAEPISVEIVDKFCNFFQKYNLSRKSIYPVYGLAEATLAAAFPKVNEDFKFISTSIDKLHIGAQIEKYNGEDKKAVKVIFEGQSVDKCEIRIVNEDKEEVPNGIVGLIQLKGPNVIKKYYKEINSNQFEKDGWFNTKDIGFSIDGDIAVLGRVNDLIYSNGKKYFCHELEEISEKLSGIKVGKIAFVGVYNSDKAIEEIICFVEGNFKSEEQKYKLKKLKSDLLKEYYVNITDYVIVKHIPKTTSGKIKRYVLKQMYLDRYDSNKGASCRSEIDSVDQDNNIANISALSKCFEDTLRKKVTIDEDFFEAGGDSLTSIYLAELINSKMELKFELKADDIYTYPSINKLNKFIKTKICS